MKILIIRHGEPDYEHDSLTPKGWREQEFLARRLKDVPIDRVYVSPLGRAKDTASGTLKLKNITPVECWWLREFDLRRIYRPDVGKKKRMIAWDWLPGDWMTDERFFSEQHWGEREEMQEAGMKEYYDEVVREFDAMLACHGYRREGRLYHAKEPNHDTIALFCHQGLACVLLSHILNVPVMTLWHGLVMPPSSVTTLVTEERRKGIASFRAMGIGDISHLYACGEEPSFAARFCECFDDDTRHD